MESLLPDFRGGLWCLLSVPALLAWTSYASFNWPVRDLNAVVVCIFLLDDDFLRGCEGFLSVRDVVRVDLGYFAWLD
jgi:hypothetical protein